MSDNHGLPPILYWSPSLAEHPAADLTMGGVIDATMDRFFYAWRDGGWVLLTELPADALRLVVDWPLPTDDLPDGPVSLDDLMPGSRLT